MIEKLKYAWYRYKFKRDGYVKIPKVLSKEIIELYKGFIDLSYTRDMRTIEKNGYLTGHTEIVMPNPFDETILLYCKHVAEKIFGHEELIPAYACSREYFKGSELKVHKDRDACQFSLTVTMCRRGEGHSKLWFSEYEDKRNPIGIDLDEGDVIVFNGGKNYAGSKFHWRDPLVLDNLFQLFLHYVSIENIEKADHSFPKPNYRTR